MCEEVDSNVFEMRPSAVLSCYRAKFICMYIYIPICMYVYGYVCLASLE